MPKNRIRKAAFELLRSRPRAVALQILFQDDLQSGLPPAVVESQLLDRLRPQEFLQFARDELLEEDSDDPIQFDEQGLAAFGREELNAAALELNVGFTADELRRMGREEVAQLIQRNALDFARSLVQGVQAQRAELDQQIEKAAENWSLTRMAATDRNVLRLGAFELLHSVTPDRVAIDEAVELAKRFGTAQSGAFVNGILDRLLREKKQA